MAAVGITKQKPPEPVFVLRGSKSPISSVCFLAPLKSNGKQNFLAGGTQEGEIIIWDLKTKGIHMRWKAHNSSTLHLSSIDESTLWSQGRSDSAALWDISSLNPILRFSSDLKEYLGYCQMDIYYTADGKCSLLALPGSGASEISVLEGREYSKICSLIPVNQNSNVMIMCFKWISKHNSSFILAAYENGILCLWDWSNAKILNEVDIKDTPLSLEYNSVFKKGICLTASEKIVSFIIDENSHLRLDSEMLITNPGLSCCISRPDGKLFATGGWDYRIRIFGWKKYKPLAVLNYHKRTVECVAFSMGPIDYLSSGFVLAAGSSDHSISLWDIFN